MNKIEIRLPDNFTEFNGEGIMSNFDREIVHATADSIKEKPFYSGYAGWNFHGKVWWQDGQWHCEVWQYRSYVETFSAQTLEEIMTLVSDEYGYE
jgi:hypothetical protein